MRAIRTILHPTDFSAHSHEALEIACMLACDANARLIVLHVVPRPATVVGAGDVSALRQAEAYESDLKSYRAEMMDRLQALPLPGFEIGAERILEEGDVAPLIIGTAEKHGCDLIVMGTHGRSRKSEKAMGSVAEQVTLHASCPVLTLRIPRAAAVSARTVNVEKAGAIF
jgi:nucleotide-binding universal stress UspA family protein